MVYIPGTIPCSIGTNVKAKFGEGTPLGIQTRWYITSSSHPFSLISVSSTHSPLTSTNMYHHVCNKLISLPTLLALGLVLLLRVLILSILVFSKAKTQELVTSRQVVPPTNWMAQPCASANTRPIFFYHHQYTPVPNFCYQFFWPATSMAIYVAAPVSVSLRVLSHCSSPSNKGIN